MRHMFKTSSDKIVETIKNDRVGTTECASHSDAAKLFTDKFIFKEDYHEMYEIRTAISENIDILKNVKYDKPFGMMRKYNRIHCQ